MSQTKLNKEVDAIVCDSCHEEIVKGGDYCYHSVVTKLTDDEPIKSWKYRVVHYLFHWYKKKNMTGEYIRYDFHPACLDEIIKKFLEEKKV